MRRIGLVAFCSIWLICCMYWFYVTTLFSPAGSVGQAIPLKEEKTLKPFFCPQLLNSCESKVVALLVEKVLPRNYLPPHVVIWLGVQSLRWCPKQLAEEQRISQCFQSYTEKIEFSQITIFHNNNFGQMPSLFLQYFLQFALSLPFCCQQFSVMTLLHGP